MAKNEKKDDYRLGGRVAVFAVTCALGLPLAFAGPAIAEEGLTGGGSTPTAVGSVENDATNGQDGGNGLSSDEQPTNGQDDGTGLNGAGQSADEGGILASGNQGATGSQDGDGAQSEGAGMLSSNGQSGQQGGNDKVDGTTGSAGTGDNPSLSTQSADEHASWPERFRDWDRKYRELIDYRRQVGENNAAKSRVIASMENRLENFETKADHGALTESDLVELDDFRYCRTFEELLYDGYDGVLADGSVFDFGNMCVYDRNDEFANGYGNVAIPVKDTNYSITVRPTGIAPDVLREMVALGEVTAELRPGHELDAASAVWGDDAYAFDYVVIRLKGVSRDDSRVTEYGQNPRPASAMGVRVAHEWSNDRGSVSYRAVYHSCLDSNAVVDYRGVDAWTDTLRSELDELNGSKAPLIKCSYKELADGKWNYIRDGGLTKNIFVSEHLMHRENEGVFGSMYEVIGTDEAMDHAGTYTATVRWIGGASPDVADIRVQVDAIDIGSLADVVQPKDATWTGSAIKPGITVKGTDPVTGKALRNGTDYTVTYKNNVNVGTATVVVTGKGNFKGSVTKTFKINRPSINGASVTVSNVTWTGGALTPAPTVKVGGKALRNGTDYMVAYKNNVQPGTATVTITGKGNYTGTVSKTFAINRASINGASVSVSNVKWTGKALTPASVVKVGGKTLRNGTDYTVAYKNNVKPGTATVTITGKGGYAGTVSKTFNVTFPSADWEFIAHSQTYGWPKTWSGKWGLAGVIGQSKRMEAFKARIDCNGTSGNIEYQAHVQSIGWQAWKKNGQEAGTTGQAKRVEAVRIKLTGDVAKYYDVYYSVYMQGHGWTKWAKNGEVAGSTGMALRTEGIRIELVRKVDAAPTWGCNTNIVRIENGKITRR